jgi:hypothetical protein
MAKDTNKFQSGAAGPISSKDSWAFLKEAVNRIFFKERGKKGGE